MNEEIFTYDFPVGVRHQFRHAMPAGIPLEVGSKFEFVDPSVGKFVGTITGFPQISIAHNEEPAYVTRHVSLAVEAVQGPFPGL